MSMKYYDLYKNSGNDTENTHSLPYFLNKTCIYMGVLAGKIFANGISYSTGKPLVPAIAEESFGKRIQQSLFRNAQEIQSIAQISLQATSFRREVERMVPDPGDPKKAGWTFLVSESDPRLSEIVEIIKPLAKRRGMEDPESPLTFGGQPEDEYSDWLKDNYHHSLVVEGKKAPQYVLIIGGPELIPFKFQSLLDSAAAVGRLDFDSIQDLQVYVKKLIRLEELPEPEVRKEAIMFAPDGGYPDATYYSCKYMAKPLTDYISNSLGFKMTLPMLGVNATKQNLVDSFQRCHPALVYTASHGIGASGQDLQTQKRINGAICCQPMRNQPPNDDAVLFTAADVPNDDEVFLEGSIFIQFACFGYGTPAESDFMHWLEGPGANDVAALNSEADFVAALPKRLLAHPHGPIAYVGHLDLAWLHGFDDPDNPLIFEKWDLRIAPFISAIDTLLKEANPVGLAMAEMNKRYDITNALLTSALDRLKRGKMQITSQFYSRIADTFITRSDAQNYMVFGDPAARLRMRDP
jgi:hypothetical protein